MRLAIDHRTHYRFSAPQARLVQMLRLWPGDCEHQTVVDWRIDVDCDARLRRARDGHGNEVAMLYAEGPIEAIEIAVAGEVLTSPSNGVVRGATEPLPPILHLRSTPRTRAGEAIALFASGAVASSRDRLDRMHRLNAALHARFEPAPGGLDGGAHVDQAFERDALMPRDFAHLFIAAARSLGVPARYVSGYRHNGPGCMPHGWAEAHVDELGWIAFDPWAGICPDECYVRMAVGLDATGAAPIAGSRIGAGAEALDVDLHVEKLGGDA